VCVCVLQGVQDSTKKICNVCVCVCMCIRVGVCVWVNVYTYIHTYVHINVCIYLHAYICMHMCINVCKYYLVERSCKSAMTHFVHNSGEHVPHTCLSMRMLAPCRKDRGGGGVMYFCHKTLRFEGLMLLLVSSMHLLVRALCLYGCTYLRKSERLRTYCVCVWDCVCARARECVCRERVCARVHALPGPTNEWHAP